jgi:WD40 repeat protein
MLLIATQVQLWDVQAQRQVRSLGGHCARVSSMSWNEYILSTGSRDTKILNHDVRIARRHVISAYVLLSLSLSLSLSLFRFFGLVHDI